MKTTTPNFLAEQTKRQVTDGYAVELFHQFSGAITDRDSATQIKVNGDATSLFTNGNTFIIPTDDFETEHVITSAPSFATGKTTLVCSGSSFATTVVGLDVAKKNDVTADVLDRGISNIRLQTEGETLNSLMADDVEISLDNSDETYFDDDGSSGYFNAADVFWVKVVFKLATDATEFLMFGGTVFDFQPLSIDESVTLYCVGHFKELERYAGWNVTDELGMLSNITGVELVSVTEADSGTEEAIKKLEYNFPDGRDIPGLKINSLSIDTPEGVHILKFAPPDLFQYDYGSYTQLTNGATSQTLTSAEGHTINVDAPADFDIVARQDMFFMFDRKMMNVDAIGRPSLKFGNGLKQVLNTDFEAVLKYDATLTSYEDITLNACTDFSEYKTVFDQANDALYILSPYPFLGIDVVLNSTLTAFLDFYYAKEFNTWAGLSVTDGTSDFSQSGVITWNAPAAWKKVSHEINGTYYNDLYAIKIVTSSYSSGFAQLKRLLKYFRLVDENDTKLNVKINSSKLAHEKRVDDVVLVNDSSGNIQPCTWKNNISLQSYLESILDAAEYTSSYRTVDNLKLTSTQNIIAMYGRPPFQFYKKKPTAIYIDRSTSPETVYLGIEDEIWKVNETDGFTYIDKLDPYIRASDGRNFKLEIKKLVIDDNGYLQGVAWKNYFDQPVSGKDYSDDIDYGRRTPAVVFRSTDLVSITEQNKIDSSDISLFCSGEVCFRDGGDDGLTHRYIGQISGISPDFGENVILPFYQFVWALHPYSVYWRNASSLTYNSSAISDTPMPVSKMGFYAFKGNSNTDAMGLCFSLGQNGFCEWDEANDRWVFMKQGVIAHVTYAGTITDMVTKTDNYQVLCGDSDATFIYIGSILWDAGGSTFPGDYSDAKIERMTMGGVAATLFDFSSDSVEANQSLSIGDEAKCAIIDMVRNPNEGSIHGCLMDRSTFEYHYFVYDVGNDKLYTTQTGSDFTFNEHRQLKKFTYNTSDHKCYAVVVDKRYNDETAYLISAAYSSPAGAPDGSEIELTFEANIKENETDIVALANGGSGRIYGITGNNDNYLFQYDDNFYPRFFLANTGSDNFRTIIQELAEAVNMIVTVSADRNLHFAERDTDKGSMTIEENEHYLRDTMEPVTNWRHRYDGVEVAWHNPFTGESGVERAGNFGWQKRILKIDNYFVQYPQLGKLLADMYNEFFSNYRRYLPSFSTIRIDQLELRDKITFNHDGNYGFSNSVEWIIAELEFNCWDFETKISAIEKL